MNEPVWTSLGEASSSLNRSTTSPAVGRSAGSPRASARRTASSGVLVSEALSEAGGEGSAGSQPASRVPSASMSSGGVGSPRGRCSGLGPCGPRAAAVRGVPTSSPVQSMTKCGDFLAGDRLLTEAAMNEAHPVRLGQSLDQGKRPLHGLLPGREPEPRPAPGHGCDDLDGQKRSIRIEAEVENAARRGVRQQRGQAEAPGELPLQVRRLEPGIERHEEDLSVRPDVDGPVAHAIATRTHLICNAIVGKHVRVSALETPGITSEIRARTDSPAPKSLPSPRPPIPSPGIRSLPSSRRRLRSWGRTATAGRV